MNKVMRILGEMSLIAVIDWLIIIILGEISMNEWINK